MKKTIHLETIIRDLCYKPKKRFIKNFLITILFFIGTIIFTALINNHYGLLFSVFLFAIIFIFEIVAYISKKHKFSNQFNPDNMEILKTKLLEKYSQSDPFIVSCFFFAGKNGKRIEIYDVPENEFSKVNENEEFYVICFLSETIYYPTTKYDIDSSLQNRMYIVGDR